MSRKMTSKKIAGLLNISCVFSYTPLVLCALWLNESQKKKVNYFFTPAAT